MAPSMMIPRIKRVTKKPDATNFELGKPSVTNAGHVGGAAIRSAETELGILKSCGIKRSSQEMMDLCGSKRLKLNMDRMMVQKCVMILRRLMTHPYGKGFNQPVDPVALNIPDYFTKISKPMDLGTIRTKLEKDLYATADEFEADIKLTFSNAMLYNPPGNPFHKMARELNSLFSAQWRFVGSVMDNPEIEASPRKSSLGTAKVNVKGSKQESFRNILEKEFGIMEKEKNQIMMAASKLGGSSSVSLGAKSSVQLGNLPCSSLQFVLHKRPTESTERMEPKKQIVASFGKEVIVSSSRASNFKSPPSDLKLSSEGTRPAGSTKKMEPKERKEASIANKVTLSSEVTSVLKETVQEVDNNHKPLEKCDSYAKSEGALSWFNREPTLDNNHVTSASAPASLDYNNGSSSPVSKIKHSPAKASRVELLKKRFANIILKAQNQTLLCPGTNQLDMEVEKQKLERQDAQNELKTGDEVKGSRDRQLSDCKLQRQREREAARIALEKMERTVEFEDNVSVMRDFAYLIGDSSFADPWRYYHGMYV